MKKTSPVVGLDEPLPEATEPATERLAPGPVDVEIDAALSGYVLPLPFIPVGIALARVDLEALHAAGEQASEQVNDRAAASRDWLARVQRGDVQLTDDTGKPLPMRNPTGP